MTVDVNQQRKGTIEPGGGLYISDGDPPLPWDVVVRRASDGTQLVARHYERTDQSQQLTVTDTNVGLATQNCL